MKTNFFLSWENFSFKKKQKSTRLSATIKIPQDTNNTIKTNIFYFYFRALLFYFSNCLPFTFLEDQI